MIYIRIKGLHITLKMMDGKPKDIIMKMMPIGLPDKV